MLNRTTIYSASREIYSLSISSLLLSSQNAPTYKIKRRNNFELERDATHRDTHTQQHTHLL